MTDPSKAAENRAPRDAGEDRRSSGILSGLLDLTEIGLDRYTGPTAPEPYGTIFGGQLLAQALAAARRTTPDDRSANSIHGSFLRPGDIAQPLEFEVERIRDGRSFSQRCVRVTQEGKEIFRALISLQIPESGLDYQAGAAPEVPDPESVSLDYNDFLDEARDQESTPWRGRARPIEMRYINPPDNRRRSPTTATQLMWTRITEPLGDDPGRHDAALAYISDVSLVDQVTLPHGRRWADPDLSTTSLDHAMWFHLPVRTDEWLLFEQHAEWTGRARGLARGRFFDTEGRLVATCLQEGLMRLLS